MPDRVRNIVGMIREGVETVIPAAGSLAVITLANIEIIISILVGIVGVACTVAITVHKFKRDAEIDRERRMFFDPRRCHQDCFLKDQWLQHHLGAVPHPVPVWEEDNGEEEAKEETEKYYKEHPEKEE